MIRRFNYTRRRRIPSDRLSVTVVNPGTPEMSFEASIRLQGLDFPPEALVFLEAYYKASYMRFAYGTVERSTAPADRRLSEIDRGTMVLFRLKVVAPGSVHGLVLGELEGVKPATVQPSDSASTRSLLPVQFADLGQQVWRLAFDNDVPILELNTTVPGIRELASKDPLFIGLVYPAVVREILGKVLETEEDPGDSPDAETWQALWLKFASRFCPEPLPPHEDLDRRRDWLDTAVEGFCAWQCCRDKLSLALGEVTSHA